MTTELQCQFGVISAKAGIHAPDVEKKIMARIVLVTGGARSGKSTYAESLCQSEQKVVYIATAKMYDDEMRDRINAHQLTRPQTWKTFEKTYNLYHAVSETKNYLLDCITILTSNIMFDMTKDCEKISFGLQKKVEEKTLSEITLLVQRVKQIDGTLIMVTNEVGYSIVPENYIARVYRDIVGKVNQHIAALCDEVYLVACGIPLRLK